MKKLYFILMTIFFSSCCEGVDYYKNPNAYNVGFKILCDTLIKDQITIKGLNSGTNTNTISSSFHSNVYYNQSIQYANVLLPLAYTKGESSFEITFQKRKDTITLKHLTKIKQEEKINYCQKSKYQVYHDNIELSKITLDTIFDEKYNTQYQGGADIIVYYK